MQPGASVSHTAVIFLDFIAGFKTREDADLAKLDRFLAERALAACSLAFVMFCGSRKVK